MKKILFLINSLTFGGSEKLASTIFNELSEKYSVNFYTIEKDKFHELNSKINYKTLSSDTLHTNKIIKILKLPFLLIKYVKDARKINSDILISFLELPNFFNIILGN